MVGRGDASSGRTGVVTERCWVDVISPVHGHIVDHELVRVWLVIILLEGDVFFFQTVVGMGMHVPYFYSFGCLYLILFCFPISLFFAIIILHHTYLSYHIACCISFHILYPVICPD